MRMILRAAPIVIIGAGPCGIGAAWTLQREFPHQPYLLVDQHSSAGGFAASTRTPEAFTFDYGGHVLFPHKHFPAFALFLDELGQTWNHSCPIRGVFIRGRLIPAPIQRNVHRLPRSDFAPILVDLLRKRLTRAFREDQPRALSQTEQTLDEYLHECFGRELTRRVMGPLNHKMWAVDSSELSSVWVQKRSGSQASNIALLGLRRMLKHAFWRTEDPGWTPSSVISYPATGGAGSIWTEALARLDPTNVQLNSRVHSIDTSKKEITFSDGSCQRYASLISSMPLDTLLQSCADRPDFKAFAGSLRRSSALLLGLGIEGPIPQRFKGVHSFQCPEDDVPFWRVTIPSNFSPGNVPQARTNYSVLCEISCKPSPEVRIDDWIRQAVHEGLTKIGLLATSARIVSRFERVLAHGYPLPFVGRDPLLAAIHRTLVPLSIISRGRFGGWRYEVSNQDHAFAQGMEAVRHLLAGEPERTYTHDGDHS